MLIINVYVEELSAWTTALRRSRDNNVNYAVERALESAAWVW